jgi:hypothetical protein
MTLTVLGPAICGLVYLVTALAFCYQTRWGWAVAYFAYALANLGLIWASLTER